jgi:hypothetical protein
MSIQALTYRDKSRNTVSMSFTIYAGGRRRRVFRRFHAGNFHVRVQHRGRDHLISLQTTIESVAKVKAKKKIEEIINGEVMQGDVTIDELVTRFLASRKGQGRAKNDRSFAKAFRATFHVPLTTPAQSIRPGDVQTWLNARSATREWRTRTFNHYRLWLRQMFDLAVADSLLEERNHPFVRAEIRRKRPDAVRRKIPTWVQFEAVITEVRRASGDEKADFLDFLGRAGVGQAEASSLQWADVRDGKMRFVRRKTGVEFWVPIFNWLGPLLARLEQARQNDRVFEVIEAGKELRAACDELKLSRFTQRGLRAMLIKRLHDAGILPKRIAEWQGHRDGGKLIQEIYTEVFCDTDATAEQADLAKVGGSVRLEDFPSSSRFEVVA